MLKRMFNQGYIAHPVYDLIFFAAAPVLAFFIGLSISLGWTPNPNFHIGLTTATFWQVLVLVFMTQSHLFITVIRAYLNPKIFKTFKLRLIVAPIIIFSATLISQHFLIFLIVLNVWWDAYHSALQGFGLARLYDVRLGNNVAAGRRADFILSLVIYMGPIFAGAVLFDHLQSFYHFDQVSWQTLASIPSIFESNFAYVYSVILCFSGLILIYYIWEYYRLYKKGYRFSAYKILLLASTAMLSIFAWGFNGFGLAFIMMNFFHAWQYFAIVYWKEKDNISNRFNIQRFTYHRLISWVLVMSIGSVFGVWAIMNFFSGQSNRLAVAILATIATLHFWYDSFIWPAKST